MQQLARHCAGQHSHSPASLLCNRHNECSSSSSMMQLRALSSRSKHERSLCCLWRSSTRQPQLHCTTAAHDDATGRGGGAPEQQQSAPRPSPHAQLKEFMPPAHSASNGGPGSTTQQVVPAQQQQQQGPAADSNGQPQQCQQSAEEEDVLIEFKDVYKSFGSKAILSGASFKIRRGEAVGIIGASGTGKSTTLRIAAGLLAPDAGDIYIHGKRRTGLISDSAEEEKVRVGMVFQNAALFDSLTVAQNVGFLLYEHSDLPDEEIRRLVADSLAKVGLRGVEDLSPAELSGGMRKRVALARAVIPDMKNDTEKVVMYDEPTAGLDPVASTVVEDLMRDLHNDSKRAAMELAAKNGSLNGNQAPTKLPPPPGGISSYVVVTHQHSTIRRAVDRIIFLHQGKVVWEGTAQEFDTTDEPIVRQFSVGSLDGPISYL